MKVLVASLVLVMIVAMVSADMVEHHRHHHRHHRHHHEHERHHRHHHERHHRHHSEDHGDHKEGGSTHAAGAASHDAHHWGYEQNGADWGGLCQTGRRQSPVKVVTTQTKDSGDSAELRLSYNYNNVRKAKIFNNGHVLQVEPRASSKQKSFGSVTYKGAEYEVLQFHFHAPAEHVIDDKQYPAEMHIVHRKKGSQGLNDLLVVGVFFDDQVADGQSSDFLESLKWHKLPRHNGGKRKVRNIDLGSIEALKGDVFNYAGSLTTPTCDETVAWNVMRTVESASPAQIKAIQKVFARNPKFAGGKGNNRAIQAINDREIVVVHTSPAGNDYTTDFGLDF